MKGLSKTFFTGLAAVLPVAVTLYILIWFVSWAESILGSVIKLVLPVGLYHEGMGVVAGLLLVLALGVLMRALIVRSLFSWGENLLSRIPLVKAIYGSVRDLMGFFSGSGEQGFSHVVLVRLGDANVSALGFVTRQDFAGFPHGMAGDDTVAVYIPLSYQLGGHTLLVSRSALRPVDMSMQDAMRFAVTAGMTAGARR